MDVVCASCGTTTADADLCPSCAGRVRLDDRYRLIRALGRGAFGVTWLAERVADGERFAIKELPHHLAIDAKHREMIGREARVLRQLAHPQIPGWIDDFVSGAGRGRAFYLVQQFVDGPNLATEMRDRRYEVGEVLDIVDGLLPVLEYLHGLAPPVIHRDLKPGNILRRHDGRLCLVDFGSVRDAFKGTLGGSTIAGTFGYMAPEQFFGDASPATDYYALGATAITLLTRRDPGSMLDRQHRLMWRSHVSVHPEVSALLEALLAPDPAARPTSIAVIRTLVEAARQASRRGPARIPVSASASAKAPTILPARPTPPRQTPLPEAPRVRFVDPPPLYDAIDDQPLIRSDPDAFPVARKIALATLWSVIGASAMFLISLYWMLPLLDHGHMRHADAEASLNARITDLRAQVRDLEVRARHDAAADERAATRETHILVDAGLRDRAVRDHDLLGIAYIGPDGSVEPLCPEASAFGLEEGDTVLEVDGLPMTSSGLAQAWARLEDAKQFRIKVRRGAQDRVIVYEFVGRGDGAAGR